MFRLPKKARDRTGQKVGRLIFIEPVGRDKWKEIVWKLRCDCGKILERSSVNILSGGTRSCGCLAHENRIQSGKNTKIDLIGKRFDRLVVIGEVTKRHNGYIKWFCKCDCGNTTKVFGNSLRSGHTKSCGCLNCENIMQRGRDRKIDLIGKRFSKLTVVKELPERRGNSVVWLCKCDCGKYAKVSSGHLISGKTKSCGCLHVIDLVGKRFNKLTVIGRAEIRTGWNEIKWTCECDCGGTAEISGTGLRSGHAMSCGCLRHRSGVDSPHWNSKLTQEDREDRRSVPKSIKWRNAIFERDQYACTLCGTTSGEFNAHHLDGFHWAKTKRYDTDNGVTLCKKCHKRFHDLYGRGNNTEAQFDEFITYHADKFHTLIEIFKVIV